MQGHTRDWNEKSSSCRFYFASWSKFSTNKKWSRSQKTKQNKKAKIEDRKLISIHLMLKARGNNKSKETKWKTKRTEINERKKPHKTEPMAPKNQSFGKTENTGKHLQKINQEI